MNRAEARQAIETAAVYGELLKLARKIRSREDACRPVHAVDRARLAELQKRHAELRGYRTAATS